MHRDRAPSLTCRWSGRLPPCPEHPFPAAPDDCEAAARWVASSPAELGREITGLVITGDSAGGNLTIVTTNQLTNEPADVPVIVQAPIYPVASDLSQHPDWRCSPRASC